jgi:small-conductance mechanosensitive channel
LKHTSIPTIDGISQAYALGGRLLLLFTAILIFVMPWTEYFWQFDRFLRGGQDFELGLLSLLTIFALVLVLVRQRRQNVALLLTLRRWLSLVFEGTDPRAVTNACDLIAHSDVVSLSSSALSRYNLPIQI